MAPPRYESDSSDASPLGKPLKFEFSGKIANNRFLKAAMTERLSSWDATNLKGGFGQILTRNIMIEYDQLEAPGNPIIPRETDFSGSRFEAFKKLATAAKAHGSLIVGQVSHPGRQVESRVQKNPISASDMHLGDTMGMKFAKPHAASQEEINTIIDGFAHAAEYLEKAGYDGIELHSAHSYPLAQLLSPTTNQRIDKYGGSLENRLRIILEVAEACQKRVSKDLIIGIKVNAVEFQDKGFTPEDTCELCKVLEAARFDYAELSGGTYESLAFAHKRESTKKRESFFLDFAEEIVKPLTKTKTYITSGFKTVGAMVKALNIVDGVGLACPTIQEPRFPNNILEGKITGAIKLTVDDNNFGLKNVVPGTQMRQIGKDEEPLDLSSQDNLESFQKDMGSWNAKPGADKELKEYGYTDLSQAGKPYGPL